MLISAKLIKKGRKEMLCETCRTRLGVGKPKIRLYGSGGINDPPYVVYICFECAERWKGPKIKKILGR